MTFTQLRIQVDALCRRYATVLEVYRLRPLAQEFCDEMADSVTGTIRGPKLPVLEWAQILHRRMTSRGFHPRNFAALNNYLDRCLDRRVIPQANDVLRRLLPKAAQRGLIPRSVQPVPF